MIDRFNQFTTGCLPHVPWRLIVDIYVVDAAEATSTTVFAPRLREENPLLGRNLLDYQGAGVGSRIDPGGDIE